MSFLLIFVLCSFFINVEAKCSGKFFECVGESVSSDLNAASWTKNLACDASKDSDTKSALVHVGEDMGKSAGIEPELYARKVLCPAKFGAGDYEVCSLPSVLCNKVYVKKGDDYILMIEPYHASAHKALAAAYVNNFTRFFRRLMPERLTKVLSDIYGKYAEHKGEKAVDAFLKNFGFEPAGKTWKASENKIGVKANLFAINPDDWEKHRGEFTSFQDFFKRALKKDARPVADPDNPRVMVAPADSKLTVIKDIDDELTLFNVKQADFNLEDFLKNKELAAKFRGGTMMIFRLSPYNYHRYHFGINAIPGEGWFIKPKGLETVDPIAYKTEIDPLIRNKRMFVPLETKFGDVGLVIVGAFNVGSINNTYVPGDSYNKAAELGFFAYGGSTLVYLFPKGMISVDKPFIEHSREGFETAVKFGQKVGNFCIEESLDSQGGGIEEISSDEGVLLYVCEEKFPPFNFSSEKNNLSSNVYNNYHYHLIDGKDFILEVFPFYLFSKRMVSVEKPFTEHSQEGFEMAVKFGQKVGNFCIEESLDSQDGGTEEISSDEGVLLYVCEEKFPPFNFSSEKNNLSSNVYNNYHYHLIDGKDFILEVFPFYLFSKRMVSVEKPFTEHSQEGFETVVKLAKK